MIISVSILDKHKPKGQQHVGTYTFEIDYPGDSHFELLAVACPVEAEDESVRKMIGRLMTKEDFDKDQIPTIDLTKEQNDLLKELEEAEDHLG